MDEQKIKSLTAISIAIGLTALIFSPSLQVSFINLILHLTNVGLVFWFIYLLTGRVATSFITSLLFGIHPLRVDAVIWTPAFQDVLFALFYLSAMISYIFSLQRPNQHRLYLSFSFVLFVPSIITKPYAMTMPLVILLIDYYWGRGFTRHPFLEKIPFFIISLLWAAVTILTQPNILYPETMIKIPYNVVERLAILHYNFLTYVTQHFIPIKLTTLFPFPEKIDQLTPLLYYGAVPILWLLGLWFLKTRHYTRNILFGTSFFLIHIFLFLKATPEWSDKYTYLASIGLFFLVGETYAFLMSKKIKKISKRRIFALGILMIYIAQLSFLTFQRCTSIMKSISLKPAAMTAERLG